MTGLHEWTERNRWIWSALGVLLLWVLLGVLTSRLTLANLSGVAQSAAFLVLPALGQMFVVTTGRGNIDLSIPSTITLSAFLSVNIIGGSNAMLPAGLAAVLAAGLAIGAANAFFVLRLRIPAMIATLGVGYILATAALLANRQFTTYTVSSALSFVANQRLGAVPVVLILAVLAVAASSFVMRRTVYGRLLTAVGQSLPAAELSGVRSSSIVSIAFLISGGLAALDGMLLAAHAGGAFLGVGTPYLLDSIAAVVLGGTLIAGGSATTLGVLSGAFLLVLIVTTIQVAGLSIGMQELIEGVIVVLVLALSGGSSQTRSKVLGRGGFISVLRRVGSR
jgi:ribose transport system permease protein